MLPQVFAIFTTFVIYSVGQRLDKSLKMGMLQRSPDLNISEALRWVEVETQCAREQYWIL